MAGLRISPIPKKDKVRLVVNGREVVACRGESVLAALIASGYVKLRIAPGSGEGRGAFCGMGVCYDCLVTINGRPNERACMAQVEDGMEIAIDE
ncbi:MAG: (2Fe-2S)-binding protein [Deltaproteobacteria bacterium]|nr:(2Fe-2S)-binding protein [Deltaproteobacteria bacterium]MBW1920469.1 (2Fe-2S)-binding protein [Deltaproteobacteria bacterium]MBW1934444.1 (2Fe-2S)-binding protein [Deltaproteobacteria bacterium]MBW1976907.1 (2Fe-2S)-binding protein [Deltaproteobacteria bacterium]MBW2043562.1 (2Fe-2S)-binding protein [Deltaproteobacteria bacterium]